MYETHWMHWAQVNFAENIRCHFGFPSVLYSRRNNSVDTIFTCGGEYVTCEGAKVSLEVSVGEDVRKQPVVFAVAPWLSPYAKDQDPVLANWHRYLDGTICYGHPAEWEEKAESLITQNLEMVCHILAAQIYKDVLQWLRYHRFIFEHELKVWPDEWPAHPHGRRLS